MAWLDYDGLLYFWQKIKTKLADKVDKVEGKGLSTNDFSAAYKAKLDGIANGANNYSHPTSSGNKHIPSGGSAGQFLKWSADGTAVWAADNNTTYNNATQSSAGLMSSTDKKKLDSVDMANACMYDGTSTDISEMQSTCDYIDGGAY